MITWLTKAHCYTSSVVITHKDAKAETSCMNWKYILEWVKLLSGGIFFLLLLLSLPLTIKGA